jgi:phenylpyruvate tautomerase
MPLIQISTAVQLDQAAVNALEVDLCKAVGEVLEKPKDYIMVVINKAFVEFGNADDPAAFVDVRSIGGLSTSTCAPLTQRIGALLEKHLGIPPCRTYVIFTNVPATHWGWNGAMFG